MPEAHSHIRSHPSTNYPVWLCSYRPLWIIAIIDLLVLGIIVFALTVSRQRDFEKIAATLENVSNSMGCTLFQGYLFSKPLAVQDFERYVDAAAKAASTVQQA